MNYLPTYQVEIHGTVWHVFGRVIGRSHPHMWRKFEGGNGFLFCVLFIIDMLSILLLSRDRHVRPQAVHGSLVEAALQ
jgi:hypothetical protein